MLVDDTACRSYPPVTAAGVGAVAPIACSTLRDSPGMLSDVACLPVQSAVILASTAASVVPSANAATPIMCEA